MTLNVNGKLSFFKLAAGFSKAVDPLSGMTVNLVYVNRWLSETIERGSARTFTDELQALSFLESELRTRALSRQASVTRVQLTAEDQSVLSLPAEIFDGFFYAKKSWVTEGEVRLQVTSTFAISTVSQLEELRSSQSPLKPIRVEKENPVTGSIQVVT